MNRVIRIIAGTVLIAALLSAGVSAIIGRMMVPGVLHPANLNPSRVKWTSEMLHRTDSTREDFDVRAPDGAELRGWKIRPAAPNDDWVLGITGFHVAMPSESTEQQVDRRNSGL